jgi:hypothetical protein
MSFKPVICKIDIKIKAMLEKVNAGANRLITNGGCL